MCIRQKQGKNKALNKLGMYAIIYTYIYLKRKYLSICVKSKGMPLLAGVNSWRGGYIIPFTNFTEKQFTNFTKSGGEIWI